MPIRPRSVWVLLLASALVALLGSACQQRKPAPFPDEAESPPVAVSPTLARILRTGELRVGTSGEQPPLSMTARDGRLMGMDIALMRVLAEMMEVEPRFVRMPFGQLLDALEAGEIDVVASAVTITAERSGRARFVGPYYISGKALLTTSPELAEIRSMAELDAPGRRIGVLAGSTSESYARSLLSAAEVVPHETLEGAVEAAATGGDDALLADRETGSFAALRFPDSGLRTSQHTFTVEPLGIAVAVGDPRFAELLELYLDALEERGALERARQFWFLDSAWVESIR